MIPRAFVAGALVLAMLMAGSGCTGPTVPNGQERGKGLSTDGIQPFDAISADAEARVRQSIIGWQVLINGTPIDPEPRSIAGQEPGWLDDIVVRVCGKQQGGDAYNSEAGRWREWKTDGVTVEQFAGAWGVMTAADAVRRAKGWLTCDTYEARDGTHRILGEVPLGEFKGIEMTWMFCERIEGADKSDPIAYMYTVLLARQDIVSRFTVKAKTRSQAEQLGKHLAARGAEQLVAAW